MHMHSDSERQIDQRYTDTLKEIYTHTQTERERERERDESI